MAHSGYNNHVGYSAKSCCLCLLCLVLQVALDDHHSKDKHRTLAEVSPLYDVAMATPQCPRAGRGSAGTAPVATCETRGSSSSSHGSKVTSPMVEVCGRLPSFVSKTVSYAQALKMPVASKDDSNTSSKLNSPCPTPSESPYQAKTSVHSGATTPSGSVMVMSSPSPSIGERLVSASPLGTESEVGPVDIKELADVMGDVGEGQKHEGVANPGPLTVQADVPSPTHLKQPSKGEAVVTTTGVVKLPEESMISPSSQSHPSPAPAKEMVECPPATPPLKEPLPSKDSPTSEQDKLTSDPGVSKDTPLASTPPQVVPLQVTPSLMRGPPGLPIPVPAHAHNLTDHQKLLTQQQKLFAGARPYGLAPPPGGLATASPVLPLMQPLLPQAQHHVLDHHQQQGPSLEQQARLMKGQDMPYHPSHTHGHSGPTHPHIQYPMPPSALQATAAPKSSVLHAPVPLASSTRPLLGNQHPPLSRQQAELLLHLLKQQQQQQVLQKHNYLIQQQQQQVQLSKGLEKAEATPPYSRPLAQQVYRQHPVALPTSKADVVAIAPYLLPNTHLTTPLVPLASNGQPAPPPTAPPGPGHAQVAAMYAPMVRLSSYIQQPAQQGTILSQVPVDSSPPSASEAPPTIRSVPDTEALVQDVGVVSESEGSEEQQSLKSSSLSITATPFIPMAKGNTDTSEEQGPTSKGFPQQQESKDGTTNMEFAQQQQSLTRKEEFTQQRKSSTRKEFTQQHGPTRKEVAQQQGPTRKELAQQEFTGNKIIPETQPISSHSQVPHPTSSHHNLISSRPQIPRPISSHPPQMPHPSSSHPHLPRPASSHPHVPQAPMVYPGGVGAGRGIPMPQPVSSVVTAQLLGAHSPMVNQRKLREEQAYQVISPQVEHSVHHRALPLRQLSGGEGPLHIKDNTHYRLPSHLTLGGDPGGVVMPQMAPASMDMQVRPVPAQKPFTHYALPAGIQGGPVSSKVIMGGAIDPLVARTLSQGQQEVALNVTGTSKRALLPTPVQPSHPPHSSLMPPHIPPTQSWTVPRGAAMPAVHGHSSQQVLYPEQRGYSAGAGPSLLGMASYHRTQI